MYAAIVVTIAAAFVLTIWFCWFSLNLALDTSRASYRENRHHVRFNLAFASILIAFIAIMVMVLRAQGAI